MAASRVPSVPQTNLSVPKTPARNPFVSPEQTGLLEAKTEYATTTGSKVDLTAMSRVINPLIIDIDKAYPGMNITPQSSDADLEFVLDNDFMAVRGTPATKAEKDYWIYGYGDPNDKNRPNDQLGKFRSYNDSELVKNGTYSAMSYWHGRVTGQIKVDGLPPSPASSPVANKPATVAGTSVEPDWFSGWLSALLNVFIGMDANADSSDADLRKLVRANKIANGGGEPSEAEYQSGVASLRAALAGVPNTAQDGRPLTPAELKDARFKAVALTLEGTPLTGRNPTAPVSAELRAQRYDSGMAQLGLTATEVHVQDLLHSIESQRTIPV